MYKQKKTQNGITLIALVVSIIVLIILAGVSIAMLVGENSIITQAQRADELTTQAQQKEAIELAVASVQAQGTLELDKTKLETALQSQLGDIAYTLTENGDGSFLLQIAERSYYIDSTGEVITQENMIAIGSADELKAFRDDVNNGNSYEGKYVYLTSDITLDSSEQWEPIAVFSDENEEKKMQFEGIFDGKNYEIEELNINTEDKRYQGMFGCNTGTIKNLTISSTCYIQGKGNTGSFVGYNIGNVQNCINQANVQSNYNNTGGIVGKNEGEVNECKNEGTVKNTSQATGGIVGWNCNSGLVENCNNNANIITDYQMTGGIVGSNDGSVQKCYNSSEVKTSSFGIGGITGQNYGVIEESFNERKNYI